ncbi:response regulator [Aeromicrobium choanae]|uniref:Two-component system, chemotaxis family, response regulator CheY n=1 Tax=Aeromicrobium choanae TaxID=1736691 RepID=A0A1T4Z5Q2_9ACTN|nr:response regulator [Aeromicrobium choanae]SKB09203.1 two-component system, chemotaxis family, response regulator CheY [Aeromicrobium choanae]
MPPTVLVVDDTASIRFLIRTNLELAGFDVIEAEDGQDCLDVLAALDELPGLITMDMMMPRMDGVTAITRIRSDSRYAGVGLVMVSTQSQQIDLNRAAAAGVDEYVTKPFDPDTLVATVHRVLESRQ